MSKCQIVGNLMSWHIYVFKIFHENNCSGAKLVMSIGPVKELYLRKILIIFLPINLNMCFGCSKELSH